MAIEIKVPADLAELAREFLENRKTELALFERFLREKNFKEVARLAHNLKGNGACYGFPQLTKIGDQLEVAAKAGELNDCANLVRQIQDFVQNTKIVVVAGVAV